MFSKSLHLGLTGVVSECNYVIYQLNYPIFPFFIIFKFVVFKNPQTCRKELFRRARFGTEPPNTSSSPVQALRCSKGILRITSAYPSFYSGQHPSRVKKSSLTSDFAATAKPCNLHSFLIPHHV